MPSNQGATPAHRRRLHQASAFTIIEILIAIVVLVLGISGIIALFPTAIDSGNQTVEDSYAAAITQSVMDAISVGVRESRYTLTTGTPGDERNWTFFIFDHEQFLGFWMTNTIIPLDIAYLDADGVVVSTYTMAPLDTRSGRYMSRAPSLYAIEVNADVWKELGLSDGDRIELPESVTKPPAAP